MIVANLDRREFLNFDGNDEDSLLNFISILLISLTSTPPLNRPKLHSYQARWCAERVVACWDFEEFADWLAERGEMIDTYTNRTPEFVQEVLWRGGRTPTGVVLS